MPEYVTPIESPEARKRYRELDEFTRGYVEAALFCGFDEEDELEHFGGVHCAPFDAMAEETVQAMAEDCADFLDLLEREGLRAAVAEDECKAGVHFWLTRNRHGAGFWDGDWSEHGDALTKWAHTYGSVDLYVGDDGQIHSA